MKLQLDNIGGLVIGGETYWFGERRFVSNRNWMSYTFRWNATNKDYALLPGMRDASRPALVVSGPLWLPMNVGRPDESFTVGGYVEPITTTLTLTRISDRETDTISFTELGLRPAPFSGGVKIENLDGPPAAWTRINNGNGSYREYSLGTPFRFNGDLVYLNSFLLPMSSDGKSYEPGRPSRGYYVSGAQLGTFDYGGYWGDPD